MAQTSRSSPAIGGAVPTQSTLNAIVRGWAEYYRYTSLVTDIEDITSFAWFRHLYWLRKKHKGSPKGQLIRSKSKRLHGRIRWHA